MNDKASRLLACGSRRSWPWSISKNRCLVLTMVFSVLAGCARSGLSDEKPAGTTLPRAKIGRVVHAEVVALEQQIVYNRFGSMNPFGMIYALKRDVVNKADGSPMTDRSRPGEVRLRDAKRPRPLVLRVNPGDRLVVHFRNMLSPDQPNLSSITWQAPYTNLNLKELPPAPGEEEVEPEGSPVRGAATRRGCGSELAHGNSPNPAGRRNDWPRTRCASLTVSGLPNIGNTHDPKTTGIAGIEPGESITYQWQIPDDATPATHLFFSNAAPSGGEGDGGSLVHGLFGALTIEPRASLWYRSQVKKEDYEKAVTARQAPALINYEVKDDKGIPLLDMLQHRSGDDYELVYGDLNAVVLDHKDKDAPAFREFTAIFHDELKTFYADDYTELENSFSLSGVRDGFAINYGSSGMGTVLLANRKGIGPAAKCVECAYEEFFLQSWANGDPALLKDYADDPSNVHHSYLNDRVEFRNLHAGPKETHVFHLHAHQWLSQRDSGTGTYLDSQTIAPQQGYIYPIYYGGSGNRNKTVGDSIFHCHLYPHFAQGMWELWRVHDVLEDGTRRLPDGEHGAGTDPMTGATDSTQGTPIPAVVPLPGQALPPEPVYGLANNSDYINPGYPFFMPGKAGHRAPQPPLDMVKDGGLPRHIVTDGTRGMAGLTAAQIAALPAAERGKAAVGRALATGDMSIHIESARLGLLPAEGTDLERKAMEFHAKDDGYVRKAPEGAKAIFSVNGLPPQPGAPFADPCDPRVGRITDQDPIPARDYKVSAIDIDLVVNEHNWHDPQGRINVLDTDVAKYAVKDGHATAKTDNAKPFFFRANSGDCVTFEHTNRSSHELHLDDFQVRTPTDTIGQHIHLVKFDVMSSDGSGNGWNYEDGTFARGAIVERIRAAQQAGGSATDIEGHTVQLDEPAPDEYQTTMQRWYADPLLEKHEVCEAQGKAGGIPSQAPECRDRTLRTVFTHDHFGPSSIQQHGFYSALLIEPASSKWQKPDGAELTDGVGTQAMIVDAKDQATHKNHREFALAIADFALLYDPDRSEPVIDHGMDKLLKKAEAAKIDTPTRNSMREYAEAYWSEHGRPVEPPKLPEAISKDHHNPFLVNYRNEPLPLRLQADRDMAKAFDSRTHGDPATEIFEGYEGERAQLRIIQGAQEVQHVFNLHGMNWRREISKLDSPLVAAQEIGISEHFEMDLGLAAVLRGANFADYLYDFGPVDSLWNGAWGFIRAYNGKNAVSPEQACPDKLKPCSAEGLAAIVNKPRSSEAAKPGPDAIGQRLAPLKGSSATGRVELSNTKDGYVGDGTCPVEARLVTFEIEAVNLPEGLIYDRASGIFDPDPLAFVLRKRTVRTSSADTAKEISSWTATPGPIEPLVLRVNAGDCIQVILANNLPKKLRDKPGDALMPKISSINVDVASAGDTDVPPSSFVSLHPQLLNYNVVAYDGAMAGYNLPSLVRPGGKMIYYWYAGEVKVEGQKLHHYARELGPVNLTSWGDIVNHAPHGLVGTLIVEPAGATYYDPSSGKTVDNGGISAVVKYSNQGQIAKFREHVVLYRDGLNLHFGKRSKGRSTPIPDCRICDDSYDFGDKAFNYKTAPFDFRLAQAPDTNLNEAFFPTGFFTPAYKAIPTPNFTAQAGEEVRFRVLQPQGRNRQHTFLVYGHDYQDLLPNFGSPHSSLVSVGKALTLRIPKAHPGYWLYRDGPAQLWAGGLWGSFTVGSPTAKTRQ